MEDRDLLRYAVEALERLGLPYLVTGSVATIFFGEPRFTADIRASARVLTLSSGALSHVSYTY